MMKISTPSKFKGFTIIELLVVIAIIATLATVSSVAFFKIFDRGKEKGTQLLIAELDAAISTHIREYPEEILPEGNGGAISSIILYRYLTGDGFDGTTYSTSNGILDGTDVEGPYTALLPPLDSAGNPLFESSNCRITSNYSIRDMFGNPLRYFFSGSNGRVNNFPGGFDLWSSGRDGASINNVNNPRGSNALKDDIKNW